MSPRQQKRKRRLPERANLPLILFGALFVLLLSGVAVAQGLGSPEASGDTIAVVEEAPDSSVVPGSEDDPSEITREEFERALDQAAARAGVQKVPAEGTNRYRDIAQAALGDLLDTVWIQGEAEEHGLTVSKRQIDDQLEQIKGDQGEKAFEALVKRSGFTDEDVRLRVALQILSQDLQTSINEGAPAVTAADVEDYYEDAKPQFELPETRDVRLVLNNDKAKVEEAKRQLEQDSSPRAWTRIAEEFSTDPASQANGGQRPGLTEGLVEEPLNSEIFAATEGELVGPVQTDLGWYVFEVEKITPARTQELDEVRRQIRTQLGQQTEQETFAAFIEDYGSKWTSRTVCNEELFALAGGPSGAGALERCSNFSGSAHPETAPPACYEESPKGPRPDCPAPVAQLVPAIPGTVSALAPQGQRLAQRPRPVGLTPPTGQGLPGATPGLPPGVTP